GAPFKECVTHGWTVDGEGKAMHKSLGNGMDPAEIFDKYGADLLRLWAASADYHADMRCSDAIFKQLSQNYLKFRNTARYCLGNLDGFDPDHLVPAAEMEELDRWAMAQLNALIEKCEKAYQDYEFNAVTHAVNDFCVVDMSNFYLDIIKDRLYCEEKDGAKRRSAQTALFLILDTMTKIMAPILAFTCDEIWQAMPHRSSDDGRNVVFNEMNKPFAEYAITNPVSWATVIQLRDSVNAALETARAEKKIGKSLEAHITLVQSKDSQVDLTAERKHFDDQWADLFIVSDVDFSEDEALYAQGADTKLAGWRVVVSEAKGAKCPRCWKHSVQSGKDDLCPRCAAVVAKLPEL
uniref:class I tRNA ligase family protein n=1 Tax=uncultured Dysosmobacter sp. TaxID=2591384 RepID=UPI002621D5D3